MFWVESRKQWLNKTDKCNTQEEKTTQVAAPKPYENHMKKEECKKIACNSSIKLKLILILSFYSVKMYKIRTFWT